MGIGEGGRLSASLYERARARRCKRIRQPDVGPNRDDDPRQCPSPRLRPPPPHPPLLLTHPSERCDALTLVHSAGVRWTAGPDAVPPLAHSCRFGPCRARPRPSAPTFSLGLVGARYMEGLVWRRKEGEGTCARAVKRKKT